MDEDFALVVGINQYASPNFTPLHGPHVDASNFAAWLAQPAPDGGGVPAAQITTILGSATPFLPSAQAIHDALRKIFLRSTAAQPRIGRRLYLFMAGHGATGLNDRVSDVGLIPADYDPDAANFYVVGSQWLEVFRKRAVFEEIVLVMDCCRDQIGFTTFSIIPPGINPNAVPEAVQVNTLTAYATQFNSQSRERIFDGAPAPEGVFTRALLEVLRTGTRPLRATELRDKVVELTKHLAVPGSGQEPDVHVSADFVFADGARDPRTPVNVVLKEPALALLVWAGPQAIETFAVNGAPIVLQLREGLYRLEIPEPGVKPGTNKRHTFVTVVGSQEVSCEL